ncbi:MAG: sigma-54-dependent transcriptional regulator [Saprospiraceae bacterium]
MKQAATILIIDDDEDILFTLKMFLKQHVQRVFTEKNPFHLSRLLRQYEPDLVLLDMNFHKGKTSGEDGKFWLEKVKELSPQTQVVMMTAYSDVELAVSTLKLGATDFVEKPWRNEKLLATITAALKLSQSEQQVKTLRAKTKVLSEQAGSGMGAMIGMSDSMLAVKRMIEKVARTDANVLILGENGTGKELVARSIHRQSLRKEEVFINVDLGAVPESLFESELFGHVKGAFTDAREDRVGRVEAASGGTLFLDEIGNLSMPLQAKMLAALQNREVVKLGSHQPIPVDIRLVCATNMPLYQMIQDKTFRQDLVYRINTVEIQLPPLRDRDGDIKILANHFLRDYAKRYQKSATGLAPATLKKLEQHSWPGNIRELRHAIERAVILSDQPLLQPEDFVFRVQPKSENAENEVVEEEAVLNLDEVERQTIEKAMRLHAGNISHAAKELGLTRAALYRRLEKYGI